MSTYYLNTEPDELFVSRQTNRLKYYQNEIDNFNEQISDLMNILRINREALRISLPFSSESTELPEADKEIMDLMNENDKLFSLVEQYTKERDVLHRKALINEQIAEETQRHEKEVLFELEEQYNDLRRLLHEKESVILDIEKNKHIFESENVVVKYKEINDRDDQKLLLSKEAALLNNTIEDLMKKTSSLVYQNHELKNLNLILRTDLYKVRALMMAPSSLNSVLRRQLFTTRRTKSYDDYLFANERMEETHVPVDIENDEFMKQDPREDRQTEPPKTAFVSKQNSAMKDNYSRHVSASAGVKQKGRGVPTQLTEEQQRQAKQAKIDEFIRLTKEKDKYLILYQNERQKNVKIRQEIKETMTKIDAYSTQNEELQQKYNKNNEIIAVLNHRIKFFKELYQKYMSIMNNVQIDKSDEIEQLLKFLLKKYKLTKQEVEVSAETIINSMLPGANFQISQTLLREEDNPIKPENIILQEENKEDMSKGVRLTDRHRTPQKDHEATEKRLALKAQQIAQGGRITLAQAKAHILNMARELEFLSSVPVSELTKRYLAKLDKGTFDRKAFHKKSSSDLVTSLFMQPAVHEETKEHPELKVYGTMKLKSGEVHDGNETYQRRVITQNNDEFDLSLILNTTNFNLDANIDFSLILDSKQ